MSAVRTFLIIVIAYTGDMIRATESFREHDVRRYLNDAGIEWPADRKEAHLVYSIEPPLDGKLQGERLFGFCRV